MTYHIALRCPNHQGAEAAAGCLGGEFARQVLSLRAVAVLWVDRRARCQARHGVRPMAWAGRGWASWIMLSAAAWSGGYVDVPLHPSDVELPERIDQAILSQVAQSLSVGEAAIVVGLDDPTPLLLVESVRRYARGLIWSTFPPFEQDLVTRSLAASA